MSSKECFRCKRCEKVMMHLKIDDNIICVCPTCYFDFTLFLSGCVVNPMVMCGDNKKEAEE